MLLSGLANGGYSQQTEQILRIAYSAVSHGVTQINKERAGQATLVTQLEGTLVKIPDGSFRMGDLSGDGYAYERPVRTISVESFYMQQHEVTWNQYQHCIDAGGCPSISSNDWSKGNRPVIFVSWIDVTQHYIPWLNKQTGKFFRLPTEVEWEYAARAGTSNKYSWGDSDSSSWANYHKNKDGTTPVRSYSPNKFGLYDMHGNASEWVQDCENESYKRAPSDGTAWEEGNCNFRMNRGGSWLYHPSSLRSATRAAGPLTLRFNNFGFRLVQDLNQEHKPKNYPAYSKHHLSSLRNVWLGVGSKTITYELAETHGLDRVHGVLVFKVLENSPAEVAGIRRGDIITEYEGEIIEDVYGFNQSVLTTKAGTTVKLGVIRSGKKMFIGANITEF